MIYYIHSLLHTYDHQASPTAPTRRSEATRWAARVGSCATRPCALSRLRITAPPLKWRCGGSCSRGSCVPRLDGWRQTLAACVKRRSRSGLHCRERPPRHVYKLTVTRSTTTSLHNKTLLQGGNSHWLDFTVKVPSLEAGFYLTGGDEAKAHTCCFTVFRLS